MTIDEQIEAQLSLVDRADVRNPDVSNWSVGQQIEHCSLSMRGAVAALHLTRNESSKPELSAMGRLVFRRGSIPRGRGQAPAPVVVDGQPSEETLRRSLENARRSVESLNPDSEFGYFDHDVFGRLDHKHTIRFLETHNEHHLSIIRDILGSDR